jgi:hypothetical protein
LLLKDSIKSFRIVSKSENEVIITTNEKSKEEKPWKDLATTLEATESNLKPEECTKTRKKRKIEPPSRYDDFKTEIKKPKSHENRNESFSAELTSLSPRWNTNSSLTEEQKNWIWEEAQKSEIKENGKTFWKCSVCSSKVKSIIIIIIIMIQ